MNPRVTLPPQVRGPLYVAYGIIGVVIGAVQVGFASAELGQPMWLTVSLSVYAFLGAAFGLTAGSNTTTDDTPAAPEVHIHNDPEPRYAAVEDEPTEGVMAEGYADETDPLPEVHGTN